MTHDELLMRLWEKRNALCDNLDVHFALSAVVELHRPQQITLPNGDWGMNCILCDGHYYPCYTINTINEALT